MNIVAIGLGCGFGTYAAYNIFTSGLSDALGLHTLRHGTGPYNYLCIQKNGAQPGLGGKAAGEATLYGYATTTNHTNNKFFVWNDDFNGKGNVVANNAFQNWILNCRTLHPLVKRVAPKYYCIQNGASALTFNEMPAPLRIFFQLIGAISGIFTPVLDFHVPPKKIATQFTVDKNLEPAAKHTSQPLNSWKYIGLSGVIYQGINKQAFSRIKQDPFRFLKGMTKIILLTSLIFSMLSVLQTYGNVPRFFNVYSIISEAAGSSILIPLSATCGITLPFICLAAS